ncbi:hypothetical protein [Coleofasciculus chthonoplastes]|uniref:hypothetical protein n=1 Tax=Coleofasciculus chthonoplastes TaxID=64178 RepID=UPI0002D49992|nr:hypothetical protein [Coleofasciculus chthonoplastes]
MSSPRPVRIELTVSASNPKLLEGLDTWLRLGLISDAQVKQLGQLYLSCRLPEPAIAPLPSRPQSRKVEPKVEEPVPTVSPLSRIWQSWQEELSVRWLLFLGVFLVVVSSGVLAATQWQNFPPAGQYGVLWAYTVVFWGISLWAGKRSNLKLTSQTLQLIALLLVPVNFWAMDGFGLWRHPWEWIVVAVAALSLTGITVINQSIQSNSFRLTSRASLILWLSYLHWGWNWSQVPLVAVYLGVIGTAIFLPSVASTPRASPSLPNNSPTGSLVVIYALTVLLGRAIFVMNVPITQLGLAMGICGWLLARQGKPPAVSRESVSSFSTKVWDGIGGGLLLMGWLVSVGEDIPWQATAVSGLAIGFFAQRLQYSRRRLDLAAIFIIGLQTLFLLWRLIPLAVQEEVISFLSQQMGSNVEACWGVVLFPYIILWVGLTDWLYRKSNPKLARFGEGLTLGLGVMLTVISSLNPTARSLNLLLSTVTLAIVTHRRPPLRITLVYLTHIAGLLTLCSFIDGWFPSLSEPRWASLLLALMVAEWSLSIRQEGQTVAANPPSPVPQQSWYRSCWHIGFVLAGISYVLLAGESITYVIPFPMHPSTSLRVNPWGLLWLLTPLTLTGVASLSQRSRRIQATSWSAIALFLAQWLTLFQPEIRLIGLGVATVLMFLNSRYLRQTVAAAITIGFALSFFSAWLWQGIPGLPPLSVADWYLVGAIASLGLWLLRASLIPQSGDLAQLYAQASDGWAIALSSTELGLLTLHSTQSYVELIPSSWHYLAASILIGGAIWFRCWRSFTTFGVYGISWTIELAIANTILLRNGSTLTLATANIILALVILFLTDWWFARLDGDTEEPVETPHGASGTSRDALEILPLIYALIGICLRWTYFTPYTGLLTLGAALTGIGVGRRRFPWKGLTYLSLAGISIAWYELVIYQMLQADGGNPADGFTILAGVAAAIAVIYRVLAWFWQSRDRSTLLNLSITEIKITAHIHWAIASCLMVLTVGMSVFTTPNLRTIGLVISWVLAIYALLQGRTRQKRQLSPSSPPSSNLWIYAGLTEVAATGVYARLTWTQLSIFDSWRGVMACLFAIALFQLPWRRWGWNDKPWQHYAIISPLLTVCLNYQTLSSINLLAVAGFYAWVANRQSNLRWTYLSLFFVDWAIWRLLVNQQITEPLCYAAIIGGSCLYIAQIDPELRRSRTRQTRHYLRLLGSSIICLAAFFFHQETGLIPGIISLIAIFAGLGLRIRAFLMVGTATFVLTVFYQLVVLSFQYPFSKWVIGLIVGIIFISIAANFEQRREQILGIFQNWANQWREWE